jgi:hypothetical protein
MLRLSSHQIKLPTGTFSPDFPTKIQRVDENRVWGEAADIELRSLFRSVTLRVSNPLYYMEGEAIS